MRQFSLRYKTAADFCLVHNPLVSCHATCPGCSAFVFFLSLPREEILEVSRKKEKHSAFNTTKQKVFFPPCNFTHCEECLFWQRDLKRNVCVLEITVIQHVQGTFFYCLCNKCISIQRSVIHVYYNRLLYQYNKVYQYFFIRSKNTSKK